MAKIESTGYRITYSQCWRKKNTCQSRILYVVNLPFMSDGEIMTISGRPGIFTLWDCHWKNSQQMNSRVKDVEWKIKK